MDNKDHFILEGEVLERYFDLLAAQKEFSSLFSYQEPNERAIAIIGGAFLDTLLLHILLNFFPTEDKEAKELYAYNNVLGTFSSRVKMVYCLGLIDKLIKKDLQLVGKIRNKFAHDIGASFEDKQIASWCSELKWHKFAYIRNPPSEASSRDLFQVGVHQLISHLYGTVSIALGKKIKIKDDFYREAEELKL